MNRGEWGLKVRGSRRFSRSLARFRRMYEAATLGIRKGRREREEEIPPRGGWIYNESRRVGLGFARVAVCTRALLGFRPDAGAGGRGQPTEKRACRRVGIQSPRDLFNGRLLPACAWNKDVFAPTPLSTAEGRECSREMAKSGCTHLRRVASRAVGV